jgi:hypothetical protein
MHVRGDERNPDQVLPLASREARRRQHLRGGDPCAAYTGSAVTPIPRVFFGAEGEKAVELQFSVDFFVTYRDNTKVGEAKVLVHGKGKYCGSYASTFHIEREA